MECRRKGKSIPPSQRLVCGGVDRAQVGHLRKDDALEGRLVGKMRVTRFGAYARHINPGCPQPQSKSVRPIHLSVGEAASVGGLNRPLSSMADPPT